MSVSGGMWGAGGASIVIPCFSHSTERRGFPSHFPEMEKYEGTLRLLPAPREGVTYPTGESAPAFSLSVNPCRESLSTGHLHSVLPCERG